MESCRKYEETLLLDVYGELAYKERMDWEGHLVDCPGCRAERQKMLRFLGRIQEGLETPELTPQRAFSLSQAVKRNFSSPGKGSRWRDRVIPFPARALAAVTACCGVVLLSGWLALKWFEAPYLAPEQRAEIELSQKELELLRNLELLEELETLRKLVHVMDLDDAVSRSPHI